MSPNSQCVYNALIARKTCSFLLNIRKGAEVTTQHRGSSAFNNANVDAVVTTKERDNCSKGFCCCCVNAVKRITIPANPVDTSFPETETDLSVSVVDYHCVHTAIICVTWAPTDF